MKQEDKTKIYEFFAEMFPHEAYEYEPEMFWKFFHKKAPNVSREEMILNLKETE